MVKSGTLKYSLPKYYTIKSSCYLKILIYNERYKKIIFLEINHLNILKIYEKIKIVTQDVFSLKESLLCVCF